MSYPLDWIGITLLVIDLVCPIDCDSFELRVDFGSVWAAKEFFGFRFSNSSDSLLPPVASLSPMLVFTSALLLPFLLFSSFDAFKFLLLPDAVVSLSRNVFVPSLLLNDVPVCPSSSEPGSFGETCGRIPRNQVGCLKKFEQQTLGK